MSFWQVIRNAFIPCRQLERDAADGGGMGSIEFGQTMIDGTAGDRHHQRRRGAHHGASVPAEPGSAEAQAIADFLRLPDDEQLARFDELPSLLNGVPRDR